MIQQSHFCVYISKGNEITILKRLFHDHIHCSFSHNIQDIEATFVTIARWVNTENVVWAWSRKEGNPAFATTWMNFRALQYVKWIRERETNTIPSHLCVESKKCEFIEAESRMVVARVWGWREMRCWSKGYRPLVIRQTSSGDLMYSKVIIVNNIILYTWKLLREMF